MKKKYIIFLIVIILIVLGFIIFKSIGDKGDVFEETKERASEDYKITGDFVLVSTSSPDKLDDNVNIMSATSTQKELNLTSSAFIDQENIPSKYTCDGDNINPAFEITGVSEEAKSLVLIMDGLGTQTEVWNHWVRFNIPVTTQEIMEGEEPEGISGEGTGGNLEYFGPCPPENEHQYIFKLYSLDTELTLSEGNTKEEVEEAMAEHILQTAELIGKYERISE